MIMLFTHVTAEIPFRINIILIMTNDVYFTCMHGVYVCLHCNVHSSGAIAIVTTSAATDVVVITEGNNIRQIYTNIINHAQYALRYTRFLYRSLVPDRIRYILHGPHLYI